jgi:hypothetical protein
VFCAPILRRTPASIQLAATHGAFSAARARLTQVKAPGHVGRQHEPAQENTMHANTTAQDEVAADAAAPEWTERLVAAANDYESMDPETLAGLGCDAW